MKLRILSDTHYTGGLNGGETYEYSPFKTNIGDMMIHDPSFTTLIAGDVATGLDNTKAFLKGCFPDDRVIFIEGNHICYQYTMKTLDELKNELRKEFPKDTGNYHFLENDWMFLNDEKDVAIIGSTFYTDYKYCNYTIDEYNKRQEAFDIWSAAYGLRTSKTEPVKELTEDLIVEENMWTASCSLNDFRWGFEKPGVAITPSYYRELNLLAQDEVKRCYNEIVSINPSCKIILMTHHCLSPKCIDKSYAKARSNASYVSDLEDWVNGFENIKLVISGHVHCRKSFTFGDGKKYLINACGYLPADQHLTENDVVFNPNLIIDTDDL
jgi:hypothetical protein